MKSAIKVLFITLVGAALALPAMADEWSKTYNITGKPDLRIDTTDASIRVAVWDQNTIQAKVITTGYKIGIGGNGIRIDEHQSGDVVEIDVHYPYHGFNIGWNNRHVEIIVQMPREGRVDLHTGDGNIEIAGLKGEMDINSGDGSETLDNVDGKLHAKTSDGHIRANGRFEALDLKTGDGRVEVHANSGSSLGSGWRLETGDGSVQLDVPGDLAADVDLHTGDGHIDLDMPVTTVGQVRQTDVRGKLNGGGGLLTIHTGDGSIHLGKS
jgi:Putative adhesin